MSPHHPSLSNLSTSVLILCPLSLLQLFIPQYLEANTDLLSFHLLGPLPLYVVLDLGLGSLPSLALTG